MEYQVQIGRKTYTIIRHLSCDGGKTFKRWDECTEEEIAKFQKAAPIAVAKAYARGLQLKHPDREYHIEDEDGNIIPI